MIISCVLKENAFSTVIKQWQDDSKGTFESFPRWCFLFFFNTTAWSWESILMYDEDIKRIFLELHWKPHDRHLLTALKLFILWTWMETTSPLYYTPSIFSLFFLICCCYFPFFSFITWHPTTLESVRSIFFSFPYLSFIFEQ